MVPPNYVISDKVCELQSAQTATYSGIPSEWLINAHIRLIISFPEYSQFISSEMSVSYTTS